MSVLDVFAECNKAVVGGVLIERANRSDKEFHFQNWFVRALAALSLNYDPPRRNTYPDFRLVASTVGFELKGLEFPGRWANFDCNTPSTSRRTDSPRLRRTTRRLGPSTASSPTG